MGLRSVCCHLLVSALMGACATQSSRTVETVAVATKGAPYTGPRYALVVGKFDNRSDYMRGAFSSGTDTLGSQAKTILKTHLQQSGRFLVMDRDNMEEIAREAEIANAEQRLKGAEIAITGDVTEFGRRTTGDKQLFGIVGRGKAQMAYAKVSLNVVDVKTSAIVHSVQGAGEFELSNREVLGFGGSAGYDSTLNGKVLNLAITEAVNKLVADLESGAWQVTVANR